MTTTPRNGSNCGISRALHNAFRREHFVEKFSMEIPSYRIRHLVKSGITGLAQANGYRGNTSIQKRVENDLYYLENWSLWLDLKIIFMTFFNPAAWKNAI